MSSALTAPHMINEEAAYAYVEARIWPNGPVCPHCGGYEKIYAIKANTAKRVRYGLKKCGQCRQQFTVKVGTIFEQSHVPLNLWLQAMYLLCSSKKGISTQQLHRTLGVTLKTAWFMSHRIREAMKVEGADPMGGPGIIVEADETFLGRDPTMFVSGKGWVGGSGQKKIVTLVERGGRARSIKVERLTKGEIVRALEAADRKSVLATDEAQHYRRLGTEFARHLTVEHGAGEYVSRLNPLAHSNTVEGYFSIFKRGMRGIYQHCGEQHLHRYLAEFDFRYSNRVALGVDDKARADLALAGIVGKRLTYRTARSQEAR